MKDSSVIFKVFNYPVPFQRAKQQAGYIRRILIYIFEPCMRMITFEY
jgi:hypothetical protein